MDDQTASALARRLAAYSASVGVALAATLTADAQVVYTDVEPDIVLAPVFNQQLEAPLDFDGDGVTDLTLEARFNSSGTERLFNLERREANEYNGVLAVEGFQVCEGYGEVANRLDSGQAIGPVAQNRCFAPRGILAQAVYDTTLDYFQFDGREGYAGFRFVAGDGEGHYGWARIAVDDEVRRVTLYGYAYEATPQATIVAGDTNSDIALAGTLNQTDFPADGGTLRFTATVTNTTDEDVRPDLWLEVGRNGFTKFLRRFGAGTVPAGATVTRTVAVEVFPGVPAGAYDVTFKIGDFDARAVLEAETFVVTKAASASAPGVLDPADEALFAVEPVAGDLFAGAVVAAAATGLAPATHALSAAMPNPSRARAAFTLEVAEPQTVRVAAYDALGREVARLHDGVLAAGVAHRLTLDGSELPAGVYAVRAVGETFSDVRTVTLAR